MRFALAFLLVPLVHAQSTAYVGGQWWAGDRFEPRDTVWAEGGVFAPGPLADVERVVDLAGRWVVPPYGDAHTHMLADPYSAGLADSLYVDRGILYALVLNNSASATGEVRGRGALPAGLDVAYANGGITSTGSHPAPLYERLWGNESFDPDAARADTAAWDAHRTAYWFWDTVEHVEDEWPAYLATRPDAVKVYLTYSERCDERPSSRGCGLRTGVAAEVVRRARAAELPVFAHVNTDDDVRRAVAAGVDALAHLPGGNDGVSADDERYWLSDETVRLLARAGTAVVPTASLLFHSQDGPTALGRRDTLQAPVARQRAELRALVAAGVPVALGADRWMMTSAREAGYLVAQDILDPATVLDLWTRTTPQAVFPGRSIGRLAAGFEASLLALACDPTADWDCTAQIAQIEKGGAALRGGTRSARVGPESEGPVAFVGVSLVPMDSARVVPDQTVVVEGGRIIAVGPAPQTAVPDGAEVVDGRGRYLMPGLADMHVHLTHPEPGGYYHESNRASFDLLLANGVTTVRNMWGSPGLLALRDSVAAGLVLAPRFTTTGPFVEDRDGDLPGPWSLSELESNPLTLHVRTEADGRAVARYHADAGYDYVKVRDRIPAAAYRGLTDEAARLGLPVVGHAPWAVGLGAVLTQGRQSSVEHFAPFAGLAERSDSPARSAEEWYDRVWGTYAHDDPERVSLLAQLTAASRVWATPTLFVSEWYGGPQPDMLARLRDPDVVRYTSAAQRESWREYAEGFATNYARWGLDMEAERAFGLRMVRALDGAGARLLLGTDATPAFGVQGMAVHEELVLMVEAGLTPFAALRTATVNAQTYLRESGFSTSSGTVRVGEPADLVLLGANPLDDIGHARQIEAVVIRGRYLDRARLDGLLVEAERASRSPDLPSP